ncbi:MAG: hypothetical protein QM736_29840 [Vicinamibacterales bacterium]
MQAANKGLLLGLPITAQSFGTLAQTAVVLGKAMGAGPVQSFQDLITALGRSSPMILDNLGLSVQVGAANEAYAKSVGKTADNLTDAEKKLAFYNAAMEAAKRKVEEVGGLNLTLADRVQQTKVAFANVTDALGVAIATSPVVNTAFGGMADAITGAFGGNQVVLVQRLIGVVNQVAMTTVDVAQVGITAAGVFGRAWSGLQLVFAGTASVVSSLGLAVLNVVAGAAELAAQLPGVGWQYTALAKNAREMATFMGGVQQSFHEQAEEAWRGVQGNSVYQQTLDGVSSSLSALRARMAEASKMAASAATIAAQLTRAHDGLGASTEAAAKKAEAAAKKWAELQATIRELNRTSAQGLAQTSYDPAKGELIDVHRARAWVGQLREAEGVLASIARTGAKGLEGLGTPVDLSNLREMIRLMEDAQRAMSEMAAHSFTGSLRTAISELPRIMEQALTGGGGLSGAFQAFGSSFGSQFGEGLFRAGGPLNSLGNKLAGIFGDSFGLALPGIGGAIGSLVGPALAKLWSGMKALFGGPSGQELGGRSIREDVRGFIRRLRADDGATGGRRRVDWTAPRGDRTPR